MPKAQVLVTLTAEALVEVPEGVDDVAAYCRENVELAWGGLRVDSIVQPVAVSVEHYFVPEPEPVVEAEPEPEPVPEEPVVEAVVATPEPPVSSEDTLPLPELETVAPREEAPEVEIDLVSLVDDPAYRDLIRSAVRARAERLIEEVVNQVVSELQPLLERHITKNARGAS